MAKRTKKAVSIVQENHSGFTPTPEYPGRKPVVWGFTLIEMIVVIFIVSVGLLGILSVYNINAKNQYEVRRELVAAGLAQEGMEMVRNIRDYNLMNGLNWWNNLCAGATGTCNLCPSIDYNSLSSHACVANTGVCFSSGRYSQCASGNTDFSRTISLTRNGDLSAGGYISVTCTVSWDSGQKNATATSVLYNNSF